MTKPLPARKPYAGRLSRQIALITLVAGGAVILLWSLLAYQLTLQGLFDRMTETASLLAGSIDPAAHAEVKSAKDMNAPIYTQVRRLVTSAQSAGMDIRTAYTLRRNADGEITVVLDAGIGGLTPIEPGRPYLADKEFEAAFDDLKTPRIFGPDNDATTGGDRYWVFAPFFDRSSSRGDVLALQIVDRSLPSAVREILLLAALSIVLLLLLITGAAWLNGRQMAKRLQEMTRAATDFGSGQMHTRLRIQNDDETGLLANAFNGMASRTFERITAAEQSMKQRNRELEVRSAFQSTAAEVAQAATTYLAVDELLQQTVNLIQDRFHYYYAGVFLLDASGEWAELKAGSGPAGQAMLAREHRLRVGEGLIGWAIANAQSRASQDAPKDVLRLPAPELPDTASEAALLLRSRGQVIGALTIHSLQSNAFDRESMAVLQSMTDQIAAALDNARLFEENQAALQAVRQAYGELSRQAWSDLLRARQVPGYVIDTHGIASLDPDAAPRPSEPNTADLPVVSFPIQVRGQVLGELEAHKSAGQSWSQEEKALMENLIQQLGVALDSARLYQESRRRAERERLAGEITAHLRSSNDPKAILQTAVSELRQALHARQGQVLFKPCVEEDGGMESPPAEQSMGRDSMGEAR